MTFGIALFIEELIRTIWGAAGYPYTPPAIFAGFLVLGPILLTKYRLFVLAVTIVILVALWLVLHGTRYGLIIRAGSRDREMVSMLGINLKRVFTGVFGLGTALAGVAGVLAAPLWSVVPSMSQAAIMPAFVVVTIGGLGSFAGAVVSGALVGISVALTIQFWPEASGSVMYILMIAVLLMRPRGLLGESWERFE
jgi:branched-chain amino acid transport system permease protein